MGGWTDGGMNLKIFAIVKKMKIGNPSFLKVLNPDSDSLGWLWAHPTNSQPKRTLGGELWAKTKYQNKNRWAPYRHFANSWASDTD